MLENDTRIFKFEKTKPLPTYLFGLIAGPFSYIKLEEEYNNIEMGLYCRESNLRFLKKQSEFIFEITKKSMVFYEKFFGFKFAFSKYD